MSERSPSLFDVITRGIDSRMVSLRVGLPGRIESFDVTTQLANVKPLLKETYELDTGASQVASLPVIVNVPVFSPGGGQFSLTMPVQAGDSCWVMFSDRSLDAWNENGGEQDPVDPRRHDLSDAVCIVGLRPKASALSEYDAAAVQLGKVGGPRVRVTDAAVMLGGGTGEVVTESAIKGDTYRTNEDTFFQSVITALSTLGGQLGAAGASITAAAPLNAIPIVGGALAAAPFLAAGGVIAAAGPALSAITAALTAFNLASAQYKSTIVKVK